MKLYKTAELFLFAMSLWFYGYFNTSYLKIIIVSIIFNYGMTQMMKQTSGTKQKKVELYFAVLVNLGCLFYYKYFDFFISNVNALFSEEFNLLNIVLPLGISFFTFQQISYVVDTYRGEVEPYGFLEYACFVSYFPQLIAGPIVSHDELIPQFMDHSRRKICWDSMAKGIYIFVLGMSKKVLVADTFGIVADFGFDNVECLSSLSAVLVILAYTFQVYFDFSGYCDMAIGLGKMMNIELPVNFDSPYKALTITDFWTRWHKTLTRFFTRYVYIPLGGNRKGTARTYMNIMAVYLISGLWHGANWTFVVWGAMHGVFSVFTRYKKSWFRNLHPVCSWLILFLFLNVSWTVFRADSLLEARLLLKQILVSAGGEIAPEILTAFHLPEVAGFIGLFTSRDFFAEYPVLMMLLGYVTTLLVVLGAKNAHERMQESEFGIISAMTMAILLIWCIFSLSGVSTFLYFNF